MRRDKILHDALHTVAVFATSSSPVEKERSHLLCRNYELSNQDFC